MKSIFKKMPVATYLNADSRLVRSLGAKDLVALGIGAVIGTVFLFCLATKQRSMPARQ